MFLKNNNEESSKFFTAKPPLLLHKDSHNHLELYAHLKRVINLFGLLKAITQISQVAATGRMPLIDGKQGFHPVCFLVGHWAPSDMGVSGVWRRFLLVLLMETPSGKARKVGWLGWGWGVIIYLKWLSSGEGGYYNLPWVALPDAIGFFYSSFIHFLLFNLKTIGVEYWIKWWRFKNEDLHFFFLYMFLMHELRVRNKTINRRLKQINENWYRSHFTPKLCSEK